MIELPAICRLRLTFAGYANQVWPRSEWDVPAILCGACGRELTIREYMDSGHRCLYCSAAFNPGCKKHYHFYFASDDTA